MNTVTSIYTTILTALGGSAGWTMTLNCNDQYYKNIGSGVDANGQEISEAFLTVQEPKKVRDRRITENIVKYEDTRTDDIKGQMGVMPAGFGLCHEKPELNGWSFFNQLTNKQEMAICPKALDRYDTRNKLSDIENTEAALKGKKLTDLKLRAAATTILHEMTHFESLFGGGKTGDLEFTMSISGVSKPFRAVDDYARGLAAANPDLAPKNADTLALFALGL
ncbi:autolysin [Aspergillus udagawae]|uniref:Autolysin n=1 Tax=Aspergillus udagawae TaxID=91492 RepID=A0ABQ1BA85_9EURO|nr:autolysin [Aspergillus udagawae]GFG08869.1 autolysin [Aspergillus udagawae]